MLDLDLTRHLADLSGLSFGEEELRKIAEEMGEIVALMDKVREVSDTESQQKKTALNYNELREDIIKPSFNREELLKNAKCVSTDEFVVPKIV